MSIFDPSRQKQHHHHHHQSSNHEPVIESQEPVTAKTSTQPRMSRSDKDQHTQRREHQHLEEDEVVQAIHAFCRRIVDAVPEYPYLLSAPVNVEPRYHYPTRQEAESWQRNTPFYLHEEHLQYMTYVYREPGESCFVVRSHIDEERDRLAAQLQSSKKKNNTTTASTNGTGGASRPGTPVTGLGGNNNNNTNKKKITLSAYKSKIAGGDKPDQKDLSLEKEVPVPMESQESRRVNGVKSEVKAERESKKGEQSSSTLKRQRDADLEKSSSSANKSHAVKKARLSPPPSLKQSHSPSLKPSPIDHPNGAPHGLPALLSPTNPFESAPDNPTTPKKNSSNPWNLPDMLSPTLPPKIEAQLQKEKEFGRPDSAASSPASKATRTPGSSAPNSASKPRQLEGSLLGKVKDGTKDRMKEHLKHSDSDDEDEKPIKSEPSRPKMIARLRYSKKLAWQIRQLLRVPPYPDREKYPLDEGFTLTKSSKDRVISKSVAELSNHEKVRSRATSSAASPIPRQKKDASSKDESKKDRLHPDAARGRAKTPEKRPRVDDSESLPSTKKQKGPASLDLEKEKNPRTPITSAIPSPSVQRSGGSIKDSITVTPRQPHLKAAAMAHSASLDSPVSTPGGKPTPSTGSKSKGPTSAPATGPKAAELKVLSSESQRYNVLGRQLKHDNQDLANKRKDQQAEPERKRMALLGIECILAYMLAYSLGDARRKLEGRSAEIETSWRTLLPLFRHMRSFVARYKPLDGLHNYLGIAINARISAVATDRLARSANAPLAADSPQSAIESVGHPAADNTKVVVESFRAMTDCARDAATKLPIEEITHKFPLTWAARATGPRDPAWESLVTGAAADKADIHLKGRYWLPIGVDTTPMQAVRFGTQIIKEWIMIEELGYEPRIRTDKVVL